jgi:hypothetical protein
VEGIRFKEQEREAASKEEEAKQQRLAAERQ